MPPKKKSSLPDDSGYQLYVRVPKGQYPTAQDAQDFVEQIAKALTDTPNEIVVEPYGPEYDDAPEGQHAAGGGGSHLVPMYFCNVRH
jgi:hypothetical protein